MNDPDESDSDDPSVARSIKSPPGRALFRSNSFSQKSARVLARSKSNGSDPPVQRQSTAISQLSQLSPGCTSDSLRRSGTATSQQTKTSSLKKGSSQASLSTARMSRMSRQPSVASSSLHSMLSEFEDKNDLLTSLEEGMEVLARAQLAQKAGRTRPGSLDCLDGSKYDGRKSVGGRCSLSSFGPIDIGSPAWSTPIFNKLGASRWMFNSESTDGSMDDPVSPTRSVSKRITESLANQANIHDHSHALSLGIIGISMFVAVFCGMAAYLLHFAVEASGCISGLNGCDKSYFYDMLAPLGIGKSAYFIVMSTVSGLLCSLIMYSPFQKGILLKCKGGGSPGTKIVVSAGHEVSGWIPLFRIILAAVYLGGGNTLGTEGPIIHLSASLATWLVGLLGIRQRKLFSMFAVVGAAAGISAGFNVLITGFVFTIEELTRTLSQKSALIITLAAAVAKTVKDLMSHQIDRVVKLPHAKLVPKQEQLGVLSDDDLYCLFVYCVMIGLVNGVVGWAFAGLAWHVQSFWKWLGSRKGFRIPAILHLSIVGLISGCLGAVVFEVTGLNGVWGTTAGIIPDTLRDGSDWWKAAAMFGGKFVAMTLATGAGGPGGTLVPSLTAGGLVGIVIGRIAGISENLVAACAVLGMGSLFASVMHMPITGIIIMYELAGKEKLIPHIILANFVASNVCTRLPEGHLSYVHRVLHHDPVWLKLGGRDFIETDEHAQAADDVVGIGQIAKMKTSVLRSFFMAEENILSRVFENWRDVSKQDDKKKIRFYQGSHRKFVKLRVAVADEDSVRNAWTAWLKTLIGAASRKKNWPSPFRRYSLSKSTSSFSCGASVTSEIPRTPPRSPKATGSALSLMKVINLPLEKAYTPRDKDNAEVNTFEDLTGMPDTAQLRVAGACETGMV